MYLESETWYFIARETPEGWDEANGFLPQMAELARVKETEDWERYDALAFELSGARIDARKAQGFFISLEEWLRAAQSIDELRVDKTGKLRTRMPDGRISFIETDPGLLQAQLDGEWVDAFRHVPEYGMGEFPSKYFEEGHPIRDLAERLARMLRAEITENSQERIP